MIPQGNPPFQPKPEPPKSPALAHFLLIVLGAGLILFFLYLFIKQVKPQQTSQQNFTRNICEDAFKTGEDRSNPHVPYIDIDLNGRPCFTGYYTLPHEWTSFQSQLLHNDSHAWIAEWWDGWTDPNGPFTNDELVTSWAHAHVPSNRVRLQGIGTLRIYPTSTNGPSGGYSSPPPNGSPSPPPGPARGPAKPSVTTPTTTVTPGDAPTPELPLTPIQAYSGAANDLDMTIEQCVFEAGKVNCWGFAKSSNESPAWAQANDDSTATDDLGNAHRLSQFYNQFHFASGPSEKLVQGVPIRFSLVANGVSAKATKLALDLSVSWRSGTMGGFGGQTFHYLYKDIPIQKKTPSGDGG